MLASSVAFLPRIPWNLTVLTALASEAYHRANVRPRIRRIASIARHAKHSAASASAAAESSHGS